MGGEGEVEELSGDRGLGRGGAVEELSGGRRSEERRVGKECLL